MTSLSKDFVTGAAISTFASMLPSDALGWIGKLVLAVVMAFATGMAYRVGQLLVEKLSKGPKQ